MKVWSTYHYLLINHHHNSCICTSKIWCMTDITNSFMLNGNKCRDIWLFQVLRESDIEYSALKKSFITPFLILREMCHWGRNGKKLGSRNLWKEMQNDLPTRYRPNETVTVNSQSKIKRRGLWSFIPPSCNNNHWWILQEGESSSSYLYINLCLPISNGQF